jgi:integrase
MAQRNRRSFGAIRILPSGRYQAHWTGPDGYKHKAPTTFATPAEAETWLAGVRVERAEGSHIDERLSAIRLAFFEAEWRPTIVHLRPSALKRDLGYVDRYILPELGRLTLAEIDHMAVAAWVSDLRSRGLEPATVVKAAQILGKILDAAVAAGRLRSNPARTVKLPRVETKDMQILDPAGIERLAVAMDPRFQELVIVACYTGLRFGELVALTAGDVDLLRRRLTVTRNVVDIGRLHMGNVKTAAGRRVVPLAAPAIAALEPLLGSVRHPDDLIFEAPQGGYIRLNSWRSRFWRPAIRAAGLPGLRIHDMRHTAVSLWMRAGTDPKAIAAWAGHRSVVTVLDRYGHLGPDHADEHLARLNTYLAASPPAPAGELVPLPKRHRGGGAPMR